MEAHQVWQNLGFQARKLWLRELQAKNEQQQDHRHSRINMDDDAGSTKASSENLMGERLLATWLLKQILLEQLEELRHMLEMTVKILELRHPMRTHTTNMAKKKGSSPTISQKAPIISQAVAGFQPAV